MKKKRHDSYLNKKFSYYYPYSWDLRNKDYLKKFEDRIIIKKPIDPILFRLRFYDEYNNLISDKFYTSVLDISFPLMETSGEKEFLGWSFEYKYRNIIIKDRDYETLQKAVCHDYTDFKLTAVYKEET